MANVIFSHATGPGCTGGVAGCAGGAAGCGRGAEVLQALLGVQEVVVVLVILHQPFFMSCARMIV